MGYRVKRRWRVTLFMRQRRNTNQTGAPPWAERAWHDKPVPYA